MSRPSQTPRSLATQAFALLALSGATLASSGCSDAEFAGHFEQASNSGLDSGSASDSGGDESTTSDDPTETEAGGDPGGDPTGGEGGEDDDPYPEGAEESVFVLGQCDPAADQLINYDLQQAQVELAPALVRESVLNGPGAVPLIPLSAQPFLNHFEFNYEPAEGADPQISGELWKPPMANADAPSRYRLQFAIRGPEVLAEQRGPVDLAIVVDLGPSMSGEPLELAEEALAALEAALVPGDRVTLIGADEMPSVIGESTMIDNFGITPLTGLLGEQDPASKGDVAGGLALAYETIEAPWDGQGQARVLLISNGNFKVDDALVGLVEDQAINGHYLVSLGLGAPELFADASLRELAAEGRGPLLYASSADDLWAQMQTRFAAHMLAAAIELEINLTLPPGLSIRDRDQLAPKLEQPKLALLGPNDAIVIHHELESCGELAEDAVVSVAIEWVDPIANIAKQALWQRSVADLGYGSMDTLKGAAAVAYARSLRGYRDGKPSDESYGPVLDAISLIAAALEAQPDDADLLEMSQVLGKLED